MRGALGLLPPALQVLVLELQKDEKILVSYRPNTTDMATYHLLKQNTHIWGSKFQD